MRILMICPQFRPLVGGYERAAERLSVELGRRGHAVTVLAERRDPRWPAHESCAGYELRRLSVWYRRGWHGLTSLVSHLFWLLLHGRGFDVWHVHQYGAHATVAILLGKLLRRPVALKLTSSGAQGLAVALQELRAHRLHVWAHRRVAACLAVSQETAAEARQFGIPPERIHRVGNGLDLANWPMATEAARSSARARLGLGEGFLAVAVGRLAEVKYPLGLVDAWSKARRLLPDDARLAWVGDGPLRSTMEAHIRALQLEYAFFLAGHSDTVADWLHAADVFVLSSRNEGMANSMLEAMASGLPSAATAVSGASELLQATGAGLVVPVGDMGALADAIVQLARNPDMRASMGARARQVIETDYSLDVVADRIAAIYRSISHAD